MRIRMNLKVEDGAMSKYGEGDVVRVAHLLKNPTKNKEQTKFQRMADLVDDIVLRNMLGNGFFGRLAQRSWAVHHRNCIFADARTADRTDLGLALQRSAIINLEKTKCSPTISDREVHRYADQSEWQDQLKHLLPAPDVVICGGSAVFFAASKKLNGGNSDDSFQYENMRFIRAYHPSVRMNLERFAGEHGELTRRTLGCLGQPQQI